MCNCIEEIEKKHSEHFKKKYSAITAKSTIQNKSLMWNQNGSLGGYEVTLEAKTVMVLPKAKGGTWEKKITTSLKGEYCTFCGVKYSAETEEPSSTTEQSTPAAGDCLM